MIRAIASAALDRPATADTWWAGTLLAQAFRTAQFPGRPCRTFNGMAALP